MHFIYLLIVSMLFSCGEDASTSELDWGHLSAAGSAPLLNIRPGKSVGVCGPYKNEVIKAIKDWSYYTNRRGGFSIVPRCTEATNIITEIWTPRQICARARKGPNCRIVGMAIGNRLVVRQGYPSQNTNLILHETGHLYGMCDQYATARGQWQGSCSRYWRTNRMFTQSAMGLAQRGKGFTWDDVNGIKNLTTRMDIRANYKWLL